MAEDTGPVSVLEWLEEARADGSFNMLARESVIRFIMELGDCETDPTIYEAVTWLDDNKPRYMEALNAMGARRVRD